MAWTFHTFSQHTSCLTHPSYTPFSRPLHAPLLHPLPPPSSPLTTPLRPLTPLPPPSRPPPPSLPCQGFRTSQRAPRSRHRAPGHPRGHHPGHHRCCLGRQNPHHRQATNHGCFRRLREKLLHVHHFRGLFKTRFISAICHRDSAFVCLRMCFTLVGNGAI